MDKKEISKKLGKIAADGPVVCVVSVVAGDFELLAVDMSQTTSQKRERMNHYA